MGKVSFRLLSVVWLSVVLVSSLSLGGERVVYAQETEECSEARLRDLGVAIVACNDTSTATACGGGSLIGGDNPEKVWNYLVGKNMTAIQAAGAMGNLQHEGGFNPSRVEDGWGFPREMDTMPPNVGPKGQPGYGIVQWTSPGRKQGLVDMSSTKNQPINDLALQLDYMWSELEGPYKKTALDPLLAATDLAEAVRIWQNKYEVGTNFEPRFQAAQTWLAQYGSGTTIAGNGSGCQLDASGCPTAPVAETETVTVGGNIKVHPCIAPEVERLVSLAKSQGIDTFSGSGWVTKETQEKKRANNGCSGREYDASCEADPPTAIPGESRHERGTAVDFTCDGAVFESQSHRCFIFLNENTSLQNLEDEAWHWSIDGG